ncbi:TetR/AcrR family transcriptional regulator [Robertmurraya yapensis]|uniref:TetR/AcrR family transcriptional regulator n=2 Tax=Bacillaceae TaxID=186817 RepID=A0A3S0IJR8_9BACI|nr:TetR/AcrR family transcriptional regulator [Bacillus yapensis]RTR35750.1 TetR/AcrR family transcriptional regulator [Bacillus yapensis]TKS98552.1 TetR family transcriptional regulator [Bacillus yapensis]
MAMNIDRRIIKSKQALKESLLSLMQEKDFKEITITDIVKLADLNRGTFYKHYQYKDDILEEIIDDVITDLTNSYREPYKSIDTFDVRNLSSSAIKIFDHVSKYGSFYTLIVKSTSLSGFQYKICEVIKNLALQDLYDNVTGQKINREIQASFYAYAIFGMIIEWVNQGFSYSSNYMAEQLLEIIKNTHGNSVYKSHLEDSNKEK